MPWTYDPSTERGKVRLLCTDSDTNYQIFTDAEIDAFLAIENSAVRLAAAAALERIAASQTLLLKKLTMLDLQTDGPSMARELRALAQQLRDVELGDESFDIAEMVFTAENERERWFNQGLRGAL
jgi:hypothetical protein